MAGAVSQRRKKSHSKLQLNKVANFDYTLLFIVIFILAFGLVMLYSTSAYVATLKKGDSTYYLKKQLFAAALGFFGMAFFTKVDYRVWKKFTFAMYVVALGLCIAVNFVGTTLNNSTRWLNIGGISVQPSEIAKVVIIICMAKMISETVGAQKNFKVSLVMMIPVVPIFAFVAKSNLSTAVIIMGIAFLMIFISSPKFLHFVGIGLAGVLLIIVYISLASYRSNRIDAWLHPEDYITGTGFQTLQALYAIGSGGLFGKGLGESLQKYIVPEAQNDMIFSIICEELGVFGAVCVILMYILLLYRLLYIANHVKDIFGSFICIGIMIHIALQVLLNMLVVTNLMPNTGVTLPLISYGGTSVAILLCEIGLALSVSRHMEFEDED